MTNVMVKLIRACLSLLLTFLTVCQLTSLLTTTANTSSWVEYAPVIIGALLAYFLWPNKKKIVSNGRQTEKAAKVLYSMELDEGDFNRKINKSDIVNFYRRLKFELIDESMSNIIITQFTKHITKINEDGGFPPDDQFVDSLFMALSESGARISAIDEEIKEIASIIKSKLAKIKDSAEYINAGVKDKISLENEAWNFEHKNDFHKQISKDLDYFIDEYAEISNDKFKSYVLKIQNIGAENYLYLSRHFLKQRKSWQVQVFTHDDYEYEDIMKLEKAGVVKRGEDLPYEDILDTLTVVELKKIAGDFNIDVKGTKQNIIAAILKNDSVIPSLSNYVPLRDYFSVSNEYRDETLLKLSIYFEMMAEFLTSLFEDYAERVMYTNDSD